MTQDLFDTQELKQQEKPDHKLGGLFLIAIGGIFLLGISGVDIFGRSPWGLLALLPVIGIIFAAWQRYQANGRQLDRHVFALLVWGLFPFALIASAIFGFNPALIWPVALIATGIGIFLFR